MYKVSVIIPTYGLPDNLNFAIDSVLNQTYKNLELIIVDDNNPESLNRKKTEELVSQYDDKRIIYLKHPKNLNGAAARNTGIKKAKGDFIAFLDSDDEYTNDRIEKCVNAIIRINDIKYAGVYTGCEFRRNSKVYKLFSKVETGNFLKETLACNYMFCTGSNLFIRKKVIDELNGFDERFLRHQDYEFLVRLFEHYSLYSIKEILVIKNNDNKNVPNVEKMIEIKNQYLNKYKYIIEKMSEKDQMYIFYNQYIQIAEASIKSRNRELFKKYYNMANKCKHVDIYEKIRIFLLTIMNRI